MVVQSSSGHPVSSGHSVSLAQQAFGLSDPNDGCRLRIRPRGHLDCGVQQDGADDQNNERRGGFGKYPEGFADRTA